ncbi:hypothetical protein [Lactobacillus bombicola]|nr:hypothetical protein [Lactobacillus bombicola]
MHGVPKGLVEGATTDQLLVYAELVNRDLKANRNIMANAVNLGAWGGDK